ncbi:NAD-dependent epimerase/dehydratase family protein [Candidatus Auribacterota bacterium]
MHRTRISRTHFQGKKILLTGGYGFIGSNLAIRLAKLGARVIILDSMLPDYGGNVFNLESVKKKVTVNFGDIRDEHLMNYIVRDIDYVFHLAGQVCHVKSLSDPFPDIDINIKGTAILMEALKKYNRNAKVIYTGTRGQYGSKTKLPVSEKDLPEPRGIYEISNLAAEHIIKIYNDIHGIKSVMLRLTNVYGPRAQMKHSRFGVVNWFIRQAIEGKEIKVFGDGSILRDFLYVDDCVEAILKSSVCHGAEGQILNVGVNKPTSFMELVKLIIDIAGSGSWDYYPFSPERAAQEPGNFYSDIRKIRRLTGWRPKTDLAKGIAATVDFYKKNKEHYW